jgi:hypothetical protein
MNHWTTCPTCPRRLTQMGLDRQSVPRVSDVQSVLIGESVLRGSPRHG